MTTHFEITLSDGKYKLVREASHKMYALRHGERWRDLTGDNLIAALVERIEGHEDPALSAQGGVTEAMDEADADTLDAIAEEIGAEFKHGARAHGLRNISRRLRAALSAQQGQGEACGYRAKNNPDCFMGPAAVAAQKAMGWDVSTDPAWVPVYTAPPAQPAERVPEGLQGALREAAEVLQMVADSGVKLPPNWRWPLLDELSGYAYLLMDAASPAPSPAERVPEDTGRIDWMEANAHSVSFGKAPTQGYWVHVQGIGCGGGGNRSLREAIDAARKAQAAELAPRLRAGMGG